MYFETSYFFISWQEYIRIDSAVKVGWSFDCLIIRKTYHQLLTTIVPIGDYVSSGLHHTQWTINYAARVLEADFMKCQFLGRYRIINGSHVFLFCQVTKRDSSKH